MAKGCIIRRITMVCTDATLQDLQFDTYPSRFKLQWDKITTLNSTGATTLIRVGLKRGTVFYTARSLRPVSVGKSVQTTIDVEAPGDFVPCARFEGAAVGDTLELYAFGCIVSEGDD